MASISDDNSEDELTEPFSGPSEGGGNRPRSTQDLSTAAEELRVLGTLIDEYTKDARKSFIKPTRSKRIHLGCRRYSYRVPEDQNVLLIVSAADSLSPGCEWMSSRCVMKASKRSGSCSPI